MSNTNGAPTGAQQNGQTNGKFPPISLEDLNRLKGVILDCESETPDASTAARRYTELRRELTDRYGAEHVKEAIDRFRSECASESKANDLKLSIVSLDDFMAEQIPEPDKLISGVLYKGGVMLISGAAKTNKSWTAKEIAISIAQGNEWLGFDCHQGKVLYVNNEIKGFTLQSRLRSLIGTMGAVPKGKISLLNLRSVQTTVFDLVSAMVSTIPKDTFSAIIIDPIYTLLGDKDENDNGDVKEVGNALTRLAAETGAAVIFVHHHSKGNQGNKRSLERASGAGAWGRFPDTILDISLENEHEKLFKMSFTLRDFIVPEDFLARRVSSESGPIWDRSLISVEQAQADIEAARKAAKEKTDGVLFKKIADLVDTGEMVTNTEWQSRAKAKLDAGRTKYEEARDWLLKEGIACHQRGANNSNVYSFPKPKGERFESQD